MYKRKNIDADFTLNCALDKLNSEHSLAMCQLNKHTWPSTRHVRVHGYVLCSSLIRSLQSFSEHEDT